MQDNQGLYIYTINETNLTSDINRFFEDKELKTLFIQGKKLLYVPGDKNEILNKTLSYSDQVIDEIRQVGLTFVPRIPALVEADVDRVVEEVLHFSEKSGGRVMPSGKEIFGIKDSNKIKQVANQLA